MRPVEALALTFRKSAFASRLLAKANELGLARGTFSLVERALTSNLQDAARRPYFLWDEDTSIAELHAIIAGPAGPVRDRALAKMLREARDIDVWMFVTPADVAEVLPRIERRLGRRGAFWRFLIDGWRSDGLL